MNYPKLNLNLHIENLLGAKYLGFGTTLRYFIFVFSELPWTLLSKRTDVCIITKLLKSIGPMFMRKGSLGQTEYVILVLKNLDMKA
jgi:hypothetical protein